MQHNPVRRIVEVLTIYAFDKNQISHRKCRSRDFSPKSLVGAPHPHPAVQLCRCRMSVNAPSRPASSGQPLKQRSAEKVLAHLIVRYQRYPTIELAQTIRQLETELARSALSRDAERRRNVSS
jgi:hypothetical protein